MTCIAFEQVSLWGTSTRLLVLHEFACICKYDNYIVVALQALGQIQNYALLASVLSIKWNLLYFVLLICKLIDHAVFQLLTEGCPTD